MREGEGGGGKGLVDIKCLQRGLYRCLKVSTGILCHMSKKYLPNLFRTYYIKWVTILLGHIVYPEADTG